MRVEHVEQHVICLLHIIGVTTVYHKLEIFPRQALVEEKVLHAACKRIVHDRIEFVTPEPWNRVMPDLPQDINIRFYRFQRKTELLAEYMGHLICHIHADAIHIILLNPAAGNPD